MTTTISHKRRSIIAAGAMAATVAALAGGGVYATLRAEASNTTPQTVTSGTLSLTMDAPSFSQSITNLAPGDVRTQYVNLTSAGTLDGKSLTLKVADATPTVLTTDATKGLRVTVTQCPVAFAADGSCTTPTVLVASTPIATLASPAALSSTIAAGETKRLKVQVALPDQVETVVNGTLPANTIQGRSASLTWTFADVQRDPIVS